MLLITLHTSRMAAASRLWGLLLKQPGMAMVKERARMVRERARAVTTISRLKRSNAPGGLTAPLLLLVSVGTSTARRN